MSYGERQILPNGSILHLLCPLLWKLPKINMVESSSEEASSPPQKAIEMGSEKEEEEIQQQVSSLSSVLRPLQAIEPEPEPEPNLPQTEGEGVDYFSNLNEDCLLVILGNLHTFDLLAVAQINDRIHDICLSIARKRPATCYTASLIERRTLNFELIKKSNRNKKLSLLQVENILKRVGNYVTSIYMSSLSFEVVLRSKYPCKTLRINSLLNLVDTYCEHLEHIHLNNFYIKKDMDRFKRLWQNCKSLQLVNFNIIESQLATILEYASQLKTLQLELLPSRSSNAIIGIPVEEITGSCLLNLPKCLEKLFLRNCKGLKLLNLVKVFEANSQLKHFSYSSYHKDAIGMILYGQISKRLKDLEHLRLGPTGEMDSGNTINKIIVMQNLLSLSCLDKLKKLLIDVNGLNVSNLLVKLAEKNTLEELTICNPTVKSKCDVKAVPFSNLKVFKLFFKGQDDITDDIFTALAHNIQLPNMTEFHLQTSDCDETLPNYLYMSHFVNGLNGLLAAAVYLRAIVFEIPNLKISVRNFLDLVRLRQKIKPKAKVSIYLWRENITLELFQYLETNGKSFKDIVNFKSYNLI